MRSAAWQTTSRLGTAFRGREFDSARRQTTWRAVKSTPRAGKSTPRNGIRLRGAEKPFREVKFDSAERKNHSAAPSADLVALQFDSVRPQGTSFEGKSTLFECKPTPFGIKTTSLVGKPTLFTTKSSPPARSVTLSPRQRGSMGGGSTATGQRPALLYPHFTRGNHPPCLHR